MPGLKRKTIHGRRMKPNTKYCTGGKKVIIFRSDDPKSKCTEMVS